MTSLPSWICAFLTYLAIQTTDPLTRDQLTYVRLVIREYLRHSGQGWLEYDRLFRQQAALDRTLQWNAIQPALQATTILEQRVGGGVTCTICHECDHTASQCAMAYVQQPLVSAARHQTCLMLRRSGRPTPICISWNDGSCSFPGTCTFHHICSNCNHPHRAKDCRDAQRTRSSRPASHHHILHLLASETFMTLTLLNFICVHYYYHLVSLAIIFSCLFFITDHHISYVNYGGLAGRGA